MIARKSLCSGSHLSAPADRYSPVGGGNHDQRAGKHSPIAPQPGNKLRNHFSDQPGLVAFIGVNGVAALFQYFSFNHEGEIANVL